MIPDITAPISDTSPAMIRQGRVEGKVGLTYSLYQRSIRTPISCSGIGLHSGKPITMRLMPAPANHGIVFVRTDLAGDNRIAASWNNVNFTTLCSQIGNEAGATVATIEHLMAACAAMEIDNLSIEIDGPEVPIMDGSAAPFLFLIECGGVIEQTAPRKYIEIINPVTVSEKNGHGYKHASFTRGAQFSLDCSIEFHNTPIGKQDYSFTLTTSRFKNDIARARTFGFFHEVEQMRAQGFGLGGSLENSIVVNNEGVMNPGGLRYRDEFVRHKILDCIGDLYLAGYPILGHVETHRSGHGLNNKLLAALFADATAWRIVEPALSLQAANDPVDSSARLQA